MITNKNKLMMKHKIDKELIKAICDGIRANQTVKDLISILEYTLEVYECEGYIGDELIKDAITKAKKTHGLI